MGLGILTWIGAGLAGAAVAAAAVFGVVQASDSTPSDNPAADTSQVVPYGAK